MADVASAETAIPAVEQNAPPLDEKAQADNSAPTTPDDDSQQRPFGYAKLVGTPLSETELSWDCGLFCYAHFYGTLKLGRGLRFNNPFRLRTQLGSSAESLSLTETYADIAVAGLWGDPDGFQQGTIVSLSMAVAGVPQQTIAPGYAALVRYSAAWQLRGHVALPVVVQPDANLGLDLSLGAAWMLTAGFGLAADVVFSVYEGAATDQRRATLVPLLSGQLGVTIDYEVLP